MSCPDLNLPMHCSRFPALDELLDAACPALLEGPLHLLQERWRLTLITYLRTRRLLFYFVVLLTACQHSCMPAFPCITSMWRRAQEFSGQWTVEPDPTVRDGRSLGTTKLRYEISVVPKWSIPSTLVSHIVKAGLPANICAIAERAEEVQHPYSSRSHGLLCAL